VRRRERESGRKRERKKVRVREGEREKVGGRVRGKKVRVRGDIQSHSIVLVR
jgi:hypothetical protein